MDPRQPLSDLDLASTLEAIGSGVMVFDRDGRLLMMNRQGLEMLGFGSLDEAIAEHESRTHRLRIMTLEVLRLHAQRLLRPDAPAPPPIRASAAVIERATRRIETVSVKLQDIATIASGQPIPILVRVAGAPGEHLHLAF